MSAKKFPTELKLRKYEIERLGRKCGLSFPPVIYEVLDKDEMWELIAYTGFPRRFQHWSWGQDYLDNQNSGRMGHTTYELIINTEPCFGFLLDVNPPVTQSLVMAHAGCGHADFFQNNVYFRRTPKRMHNVFGDHASTMEALRTEYGKELVDRFLEACMSLGTMIDLQGGFIERFPTPQPKSDEARSGKKQPQRLQAHEPLPYYMNDILNPPEFIEEQRRRIRAEEQKEIDVERGVKLPPWPVRDALGFLLLYAPLERWQLEILRIIREESNFLYSSAQTKIMNEGWASYWHEEIMVMQGMATDAEIYPFAALHAGILSSSGINPYKLGLALWKDIRFRWDTGRHGDIYDDCPVQSAKERWDEFAVCKFLADRHGLDTPGFRDAWNEFAMLIQETFAGNGSYPAEYFSPLQYVTEWLQYDRATAELSGYESNLPLIEEAEHGVAERLGALVGERANGNGAIAPDLLRYKARYDVWVERGEPPELLWTAEEWQREIRRRQIVVSLRERWQRGETTLREPIPIPDGWRDWIRKNPEPIRLGLGREKMFEVRRIYNDISFVEEFFTEDFCFLQGYYTYGVKHDQWLPDIGITDVWAVRSRNYERVKALIIGMFLNVGMPQVEIADANYANNRELLVCHLHDGRDLEDSDLREVLKRLWIVWGSQKSVHLETIQTEWPKKKPWWERWHPPWYPPLPPQEIKRRKTRFSCRDGAEVTMSYL